MKTHLFIKIALFSMSLLSIAVSASGQQAQPLQSPSPSPQPTTVDVVYTGRLLGYFRVPSLQDFNPNPKTPDGCPVSGDQSRAAKEFLDQQKKLAGKATVLVGTGDNFGPELEARVFSNPPPQPSPSPSQSHANYAPGNKELFVGNGNSWLFYDQLKKNKELKKRIDDGRGTIPSDNVGCFLRLAGYAAIVPGKHDFYFGAERLRQLARFLAEPEFGNYKPVQMLGANLVMKTIPIETKEASAKVVADRSFLDWPSEYPVLNVKDGKSVYPWFSTVKIKLIEFSPKLLKKLREKANAEEVISGTKWDEFIAAAEKAADTEDADKKRLTVVGKNLTSLKSVNGLRICKAEKEGAPNQLPDKLSTCDAPEKTEIRLSGNAVHLYVYLQRQFDKDKRHFSTLDYGKNFGLCTVVPDPVDNKTPKNACLRFSSYTPFFYFPHKFPNEKDDKDPERYVDPEPYVLTNNVAIFGVVDPTLGEQVGALNLGWRHDDHPELTTRVSAEDPADALQQQLDYFEIQNPTFNGLKVLLAQMAPQRARALAARFKQFQIVVSAADQEQATSNVKMSTNWKPGPQASGQFLAVPTPYFNASTRKGSVHTGVITANPKKINDAKESQQPEQESQQSEKKEESSQITWELSAEAHPGIEVKEPEDSAQYFWSRIKKLPGCLQPDFDRRPDNEHYDNQTYLKWLVLCTMQQHLGSDVALIQTRDLFEVIPDLSAQHITRGERLKPPTDPVAKEKYDKAEFEANLQQTLDRLIWKGDLITLLHVPGSALKKALKQSDDYEAAESATLSLSVDRGRKLETLGIRKTGDEYFINELPIDDNRIYAVATSDYIGAGDTGYPDLAKDARNPRTHPAAFPEELISISSLVCKKFFNKQEGEQHCLGPVKSSLYLDTTTAKQIPTYPSEGKFSQLLATTGIALPKDRKESNDPKDGLEQRVQRRSFWGFSLKNFSIGIKNLDNNRTDDSLKEHFAGVPTSGVNSQESRALSLGVDTRLSYFADRHEFFLAGGIDYERKSQGDPTLAVNISLDKNKVFLNPGFVWWRRPGRELPNIGAVASVYGETQLEAPFSAFNLKTEAKDQIRIPQKRGLLVMGRLGVRWQNKSNSFEIGGQVGREFRALEKYHFENPGGTPVDCLVESAKSLGTCIEENSTPPDGKIVSGSMASAVTEGRPRAGIYWNHTFTFPFTSKIKYEATQDADFFFVNFHRDTSIDTRFRYNSKNRLSFMVWPNFSIGPVLELFMYQNKVNRSFLFQQQFGIETKLNFDIFNRRDKKAQVRSRP